MSTDFDARVFASRLNSCMRKSSRRPLAPGSERIRRTSATWLPRLLIHVHFVDLDCDLLLQPLGFGLDVDGGEAVGEALAQSVPDDGQTVADLGKPLLFVAEETPGHELLRSFLKRSVSRFAR